MLRHLQLILSLTLAFTLSAQTHRTVTDSFEVLHVSGSVALNLVYSADSVAAAYTASNSAVSVQKLVNDLYISSSSATPLERIPVTLTYNNPLTIVDVAGRAVLKTDSLVSQTSLTLISAGASEICVSALTAPNINVSLTGSGSLSVLSAITASSLNFSITGSGKVIAAGLTVNKLSATLRGSGKLQLGGSSHHAAVALRGSGVIELRNLVSTDLDLRLNGTGKIFYPSGVHAKLSGDVDRILQVKPYHPL